MAEKIDVDITPGTKDKEKKHVFQQTEQFQMMENPARLTKEGVQKKIEIWKESANRHVQSKYETMLKRGIFSESGTTTDGKIILSRNPDGSARWVEDPDKPKHKEMKK